MSPQMVSRTQRRLERKQALVLLALVLAVSLVSFFLGVMVGRGKDPETAAGPANERLPVSIPKDAGTAAADSAVKAETEKLTFYDVLPKGEQPPIGSGINLPPPDRSQAVSQPESAAKVQKTAAPSAQAGQDPPIQGRKKAGAKATEKQPAAGAWILQVASFQGADDARNLQERLTGKGHPSFVRQADLGEKGIWHRVMVGPFPSKEAAAKAAGRLQDEEKLSAFLRNS